MRCTVALAALLFLFPAATHAQIPFWTDATAEVDATGADAAKGGLLAIQNHVDRLERLLAEGASHFPLQPNADGSITLLTDGRLETVAVLARTATGTQRATAVFNPYPSAALYLALYYNEIHKPDEALRVIAAAMTVSTPDGLQFGEHVPTLYTEQAAALGQLKRFQEAFEICDKGLQLSGISTIDKARLYRCRGFAQTELDRLDDAQTSYEESLKVQPGNPLALRELAYIARLKAGGTRAPPEQLVTPPPPAEPAQEHKKQGSPI